MDGKERNRKMHIAKVSEKLAVVVEPREVSSAQHLLQFQEELRSRSVGIH